METQVLGLSVDSVPCLKAWADSLGGIEYPLLSDFYPHGRVAQEYGVLRDEGFSERAIFVLDKQGIIRYVDVHDIDSQPDNEVLFAELGKLEPVARAAASASIAAPSSEPDVDVAMYCTPWCPDCRRARAFFREHSIEYTEIDISRDRAAAQRVKGWANNTETTPTLKIRGTVIVGFDEARVRAALGL